TPTQKRHSVDRNELAKRGTSLLGRTAAVRLLQSMSNEYTKVAGHSKIGRVAQATDVRPAQPCQNRFACTERSASWNPIERPSWYGIYDCNIGNTHAETSRVRQRNRVAAGTCARCERQRPVCLRRAIYWNLLPARVPQPSSRSAECALFCKLRGSRGCRVSRVSALSAHAPERPHRTALRRNHPRHADSARS